MTARDPGHRESHLQMAGCLSVEEYGSSAGLAEFLCERQHCLPSDSPARLASVTIAVREYRRHMGTRGLDAPMRDRWWSRADPASVLEDGVRQLLGNTAPSHAAWLADLNALAFPLLQADRTAEAAAAFRSVGPVVTAEPWIELGDPVVEFRYWRGFALRHA